MSGVWLVLLGALVAVYVGLAMWALGTTEPDPDEE